MRVKSLSDHGPVQGSGALWPKVLQASAVLQQDSVMLQK